MFLEVEEAEKIKPTNIKRDEKVFIGQPVRMKIRAKW